jgi:hypothetical protein
MFQVIGKILGSGDVISKGMSLIDDMHTSTEEEIVAKASAKTQLLSAYAPFKIAQRVLAIMFAFVFLSSYILTLTMTIIGKGNPSDVTMVMEQFSLNYAMLIILGFYFGGGAVEGFLDRKGKK